MNSDLSIDSQVKATSEFPIRRPRAQSCYQPLPSKEGTTLEVLRTSTLENLQQNVALTVLCVPYSLDSSTPSNASTGVGAWTSHKRLINHLQSWK